MVLYSSSILGKAKEEEDDIQEKPRVTAEFPVFPILFACSAFPVGSTIKVNIPGKSGFFI